MVIEYSLSVNLAGRFSALLFSRINVGCLKLFLPQKQYAVVGYCHVSFLDGNSRESIRRNSA